MKIAKQDIIFVVIVRILGLSYKERLKLQAFFVYTVLILDYYNFFYLCTHTGFILFHIQAFTVYLVPFSASEGISNSPVLLFISQASSVPSLSYSAIYTFSTLQKCVFQ